MTASTNSETLDVTETDRELVRTAAVGLGIWLVLTLVAVALLMLFGDAIAAVFV